MPHNLAPYTNHVEGEYAYFLKRSATRFSLFKSGRIIISLRTYWYLFFGSQLAPANLYLGLTNDKIDRSLSLATASCNVFTQYLFGSKKRT